MYNDEKYQEMYRILVEQLLLRPEQVIANINCLVHNNNLEIEIRLLRADPCKMHHEHVEQKLFHFGGNYENG
jgi:hypothetical protein